VGEMGEAEKRFERIQGIQRGAETLYEDMERDYLEGLKVRFREALEALRDEVGKMEKASIFKLSERQEEVVRPFLDELKELKGLAIYKEANTEITKIMTETLKQIARLYSEKRASFLPGAPGTPPKDEPPKKSKDEIRKDEAVEQFKTTLDPRFQEVQDELWDMAGNPEEVDETQIPELTKGVRPNIEEATQTLKEAMDGADLNMVQAAAQEAKQYLDSQHKKNLAAATAILTAVQTQKPVLREDAPITETDPAETIGLKPLTEDERGVDVEAGKTVQPITPDASLSPTLTLEAYAARVQAQTKGILASVSDAEPHFDALNNVRRQLREVQNGFQQTLSQDAQAAGVEENHLRLIVERWTDQVELDFIENRIRRVFADADSDDDPVAQAYDQRVEVLGQRLPEIIGLLASMKSEARVDSIIDEIEKVKTVVRGQIAAVGDQVEAIVREERYQEFEPLLVAALTTRELITITKIDGYEAEKHEALIGPAEKEMNTEANGIRDNYRQVIVTELKAIESAEEVSADDFLRSTRLLAAINTAQSEARTSQAEERFNQIQADRQRATKRFKVILMKSEARTDSEDPFDFLGGLDAQQQEIEAIADQIRRIQKNKEAGKALRVIRHFRTAMENAMKTIRETLGEIDTELAKGMRWPKKVIPVTRLSKEREAASEAYIQANVALTKELRKLKRIATIENDGKKDTVSFTDDSVRETYREASENAVDARRKVAQRIEALGKLAAENLPKLGPVGEKLELRTRGAKRGQIKQGLRVSEAVALPVLRPGVNDQDQVNAANQKVNDLKEKYAQSKDKSKKVSANLQNKKLMKLMMQGLMRVQGSLKAVEDSLICNTCYLRNKGFEPKVAEQPDGEFERLHKLIMKTIDDGTYAELNQPDQVHFLQFFFEDATIIKDRTGKFIPIYEATRRAYFGEGDHDVHVDLSIGVHDKMEAAGNAKVVKVTDPDSKGQDRLVTKIVLDIKRLDSFPKALQAFLHEYGHAVLFANLGLFDIL